MDSFSLTAARRKLPRPVKQVLRKLSPWRRPRQWQHLRDKGTKQRWKLIEASLDPTDRSLLDVGCNTGMLTIAAANHGMEAHGVDLNAEAIDSAKRAARRVDGATFELRRLSADDIRGLPEFDVVLLLSVFHQWVALDGEEAARAKLADLAGKARSRFYFEPASIRAKYGTSPPAITDADERSIVQVNTKLVEDVAGEGSQVRYLGATPTVDADEGFRCLFVVEAVR